MAQEKKKETFITSNPNQVLELVTPALDFVAIGEIHNSRSAIKFIMENLDTKVGFI